MLTAYDYPTAAAAQAAGIHSLLVGDSLGSVVLGQPNTRAVKLDLMIPLAEAVRRAAPHVFLVGDVPFECMRDGRAVRQAAQRFSAESGCDAVKMEAERRHAAWVEDLARGGHCVIAHIGLRPQSVLTADGYRAQARDDEGIAELVEDARVLVDAGARLLLLEAVPNEASLAVMAAVDVPVIGCGAGPACDGHVVVTHDLLGFGAAKPPRFVPVLADLRGTIEGAMREYSAAIESGAYPGPQHVYPLRKGAPLP
jgi:3-methyl-2-oxobutanoate hydroxymethyltransferase